MWCVKRRLSGVELGVRLAHIGVIALIDQVFFGRDVVVQAGFGETQATRDVSKRCRASALGVEELGRTGQHRSAFGLALQAATEG